MGWDLVAIGTNHTLPLKDPKKVAERMASILNGIISIGYSDYWGYDVNTQTIIENPGKIKWCELDRIETNPQGTTFRFEITGENEKRIFSQIKDFSQTKFEEGVHKEWFLEGLSEPEYDYYRIDADDAVNVSYLTYIYRDIVELYPSFPYGGRWFGFERVFKEPYSGENKRILDNFRKDIYKQLSAYGCDNAYYFPDQGFGERLYEYINHTTNEWVDFMQSRSYICDDCEDLLIFNMSDYLSGEIILSPGQNIICIIDDFADFRD
ncbi:MAG: hypothetical protein K2L14_02905 [Duncaniella sp.]|nr:hypothetical protein [Duncaniella sp.]